MTVETKGFNQRGEEVCFFRRNVMVWTREALPPRRRPYDQRSLELTHLRTHRLSGDEPQDVGVHLVRPARGAGSARHRATTMLSEPWARSCGRLRRRESTPMQPSSDP